MIKVIEVDPQNMEMRQQMAHVLVEGFRHPAPDAWPTMEEGLEEVEDSFEEGNITLAAVDEKNDLVGWVGGQHEYARVWELHPLVVDPAYHKRGIGRMLVEALEPRVKEKGGLTLILGTDDHIGQTSIFGVDLYPNVWEHIPKIENLHGHAFGFYQKMGFVIYGLIPDANGLGQHDIMMAKRL